MNATNAEGMSPLFYVVNRDFMLTQLLLDAGANINAQNRHGRTPLMVAVSALFGSTGKMEIVQELLRRGAKTTIPDNSGRTILDWFSGTKGTDWFNPLYWATQGLLELELRHLLHKAPRT